jgi:hypothetical protein
MTAVVLLLGVVWLARGAIRVHRASDDASAAQETTNHTARLTQLQHIEAQLKARLAQQESPAPAAARPSLQSVSQIDRDAKAKATRAVESVTAHVAKTLADRSALNEARSKLTADDEALLHDGGESLHATLRKQLERAKATAQQLHADASDAERAAIERKLEHKFSELLHSVQSSRMHGAVDPATAARTLAKSDASSSSSSSAAAAATAAAAVTSNADSFAVDIKARFARVDKSLVPDAATTTAPPAATAAPVAPTAKPKNAASDEDVRERQNSNFVRRQKERLKTEL